MMKRLVDFLYYQPQKGGTYWYCPQCVTAHRRFRHEKTARRHMRRLHASSV